MTDMIFIIGIFAFVITMAVVTYAICKIITEYDRQRNEYLYGIKENLSNIENMIQSLKFMLERQMQCNTQRLKFMQDDFKVIIGALQEPIEMNEVDNNDKDMIKFKDNVDKFCQAFSKYGGNLWNY